MSHMEMIFIDSDAQGLKTGVGAMFETPLDTWRAFLSAKPLAVPSDEAEFVLDYYNRHGDLADSIPLSRAGFEQITRERALCESEYRAIDGAFWDDVRAAMSVEHAGALAIPGNASTH